MLHEEKGEAGAGTVRNTENFSAFAWADWYHNRFHIIFTGIGCNVRKHVSRAFEVCGPKCDGLWDQSALGNAMGHEGTSMTSVPGKDLYARAWQHTHETQLWPGGSSSIEAPQAKTSPSINNKEAVSLSAGRRTTPEEPSSKTPKTANEQRLVSQLNAYTYIYIYTYTYAHMHTYMCLYMYVFS